MRSPTKVATIALTTNPYWITFSLDGRYAYPATGDVIDTATRKKVFTIVDRASKQVQSLEVRPCGSVGDGLVVRAAGRAHGLGVL